MKIIIFAALSIFSATFATSSFAGGNIISPNLEAHVKQTCGINPRNGDIALNQTYTHCRAVAEVTFRAKGN